MLLSASAATIAFAHTLLGPDHYLPFVAMAKANAWSMRRTVGITLLCGAGHIVGSVLLGFIGIFAGIQLSSLQSLEELRGGLAAWALLAFGLVYMVWGLRRAAKSQSHSHWHSHGRLRHCHTHTHHQQHTHAHTGDNAVSSTSGSLAPWLIFVIFVLGPCEVLIPLLMFPAATESLQGVIIVTSVFAAVTVVTMLAAVLLSVWGLRFVRLPGLERYSHALAGSTIMLCGLSIAVLPMLLS